MDEFGAHLGSEREGDLGLENPALQERASGLVSGQLDELKLHQEGCVSPDRCRPPSISRSVSSAGEGKGHSTAPMDFGLRLRKDGRSVTDDSLATGFSASVMSSSPSHPSRRTSSAKCFCASPNVTVCMK
jgi:hypothetical protein